MGGGGASPTTFSEDVVPLSDLKANPAKIAHQVDTTRRPVLLTSRGRGVAVVHLDMHKLEALDAETDSNDEEQATSNAA